MHRKIGYLGPAGTFTEEALIKYTGSDCSERVACGTINAVFRGVKDGSLDLGLVPFENSTEGSVHLTLDLLAGECDLKISGEIIMPISQHLIARAGASADRVARVLSHPQALAQCRLYLENNLPGIEVENMASTVEAIRAVAETQEPWAAIGNARAAEMHGLAVIASDIQDCRENRTRFVVISREDAPVAGESDKTSILFTITDRPGGLYEILKEFALRNINLTRIESRPAKRNLGDYVFFVDLEGHREDPQVRACLEAVRNQAATFRILGSYPADAAAVQEGHREVPRLSLEQLRQDIDIIDQQIVELLAKRTELVKVIGRLKSGQPEVRDPDREEQVLRRVKASAEKKGVNPELINNIYHTIFDHFVEVQKKQKI
jgi:prephenate dehydratase